MSPDDIITICNSNGSQTEVAKITGYSSAYINRLIHGKDKITNKIIYKFKQKFPDYFIN
jgi:plasmid maintenance system antidote protein VapI